MSLGIPVDLFVGGAESVSIRSLASKEIVTRDVHGIPQHYL